MNSSNKVLWFVAGASIGATLALLFAPQSGQETRDYIGNRVRRGREVLDEVGYDAFEAGRDLFEKGRALADEVADDVISRGRNLFEG